MRERVEAIIQLPSGEWLEFVDPATVVVAHSPSAVRPVLADVERLTRDLSLYAVGFVAYEAGLAFNLETHPPEAATPLAWFGLFETQNVRPLAALAGSASYRLGPLHPSIERNEFQRAFDAIKGHLAAGDTYQVNFTFKMAGEFGGEPRALFADLVEVQRSRHCGYIRIGDWAICSASPELFFELDGLSIQTRPMKGTAPRGLTALDDRRRRDELQASDKQRAENVMIVDMMRNDLGRIAEVGSVDVPQLFSVEQYPNVWQMTSEVTARTRASLPDIFAALHPSASVTGAPKVRTTAILSELERSPRGVYTGAIGYVPPDGNASFNVAIRTAVVDVAAGQVEFGIGSGIVWDSDAGAEYDECLLKGSVLGQAAVRFELLETLRWTPGDGYFLRDRHVERLREAAGYFDFALDPEVLQTALDAAMKDMTQPRRVRLLVQRDGSVRVEHTPLGDAKVAKVAIASEPIDPLSVWLYHKTTRRALYDTARSRVSNCDDVILWNPAHEVTEATTANIVADMRGTLVTPPVSCGLLAGTFRAELLERGEIQEQVVTLDDLRSASRLWLINSVYEWRTATVDFGSGSG
ncbi:MAG TPA: aminodeoxychorismate synthase component I [Vicinamibacterales bacterium]